MKAARISIAVAFLQAATLCILSKPTLADEDSKNPLKSFSSAELVRLLDSDDGMNRTAATREMFVGRPRIPKSLVATSTNAVFATSANSRKPIP